MFKKALALMLAVLFITALPCSAAEIEAEQPEISVAWTDFRGYLFPIRARWL